MVMLWNNFRFTFSFFEKYLNNIRNIGIKGRETSNMCRKYDGRLKPHPLLILENSLKKDQNSIF